VSAYTVTLKKPVEDFTFAYRLHLDRDKPDEAFVFSYFDNGRSYEPEITYLMLRAIKPGDFVIDVGANIGVFTVLMANLVGSNGLVLAVEPDPYNLIVLRNNLRLNNLTNVRIIDRPLWHSEEEVSFYPCCDSTGSGAIWDVAMWPGNKKTRLKNLEPVKFMSSTLDKEIQKIGRKCKLIKVDTEGADESILHGLGSSRPDFIVAELNPFGQKQFGHDDSTFRNFMRSLGYDCFLIFDDGRMPALVPPGSEIGHGPNGFIFCNVLFSTLENLSTAWPLVTNIRDGVLAE
jgi:FkbM family methyltransferase